jgi:hypothetical protein
MSVENEALSVVEEVSPPGPPVPEERGGTPPAPEPQAKPRSGFGRMKVKIARLTELYENMRNDYEAVCIEFDRLQAEHDKTLLDCAKLEVAFDEVTELNAELAGELRQLKQHRNPVRYGALMGV